MAESIFKGPSYYEEDDKNRFLGRDKETEDLLYLVDNSDFCVCYAESGEGKSSLINAGLKPKMREKGMFPIHITFNENDFARTPVNNKVCEDNPNNINFDQLIWKKIDNTIRFARNTEQFGDLYKTLTIQNSIITEYNNDFHGTIWWKLRFNDLRINSYESVIPVLIFDQFEEIFTRAKDIAWTDSFFKWLEGLYEDDRYADYSIDENRTKKFKVLLSLRSDYVCELDYWCMNKYFIPSLKNNRYCLKPLSKHSAYKIVHQLTKMPKGISHNEIIKSAKIERSGDWATIDDYLPCISALILSLVLTGLENEDDEITNKLNDLVAEDKENISDEFLFFVMNNIYERALNKSGIGTNSVLRDILEETLVDTNGRRRVVSRLDKNLQSIPEYIINNLAKERIIIVSGMNVEISHDCLRSVVEKHNIERQKMLEYEKRRNNILLKAAERTKHRVIRQKHNIYVFFILLISYSLSYLFLRFHSYDIIVPFFGGGGKILNVPLSVLKEFLFVFIIILIPSICIFQSYHKKWGRIYVTNVTSMSTLFLIFYLFLVFYDTVICPVERYVSTCDDSAPLLWGVPFFFFLIYQRKPLWHYILYAIMLVPLAINAVGKWQIPAKILIVYLCIVVFFIIFSFVKCKTRIYFHPQRELTKLLWIILNIIVLLSAIFFQLGFDVRHVDYDNAIRNNLISRGWKTIVAKEYDKYCLLDAQYGDTILPCVFDSIYYNRGNLECSYLYISDTINVEDGNYGVFKVKSLYGKDSLKVSIVISPEFECSLSRMRSLNLKKANLRDSLMKTSAIVYNDLRNGIINYLRTGNTLDISDIRCFDMLDSLHKEQTGRTLSVISAKVDSLNDNLINTLYRAVYSDLCLCSIKDRIANHDINGVMELFSHFQTCEFQEEQSKTLNTFYQVEVDSIRFAFSSKDLVAGHTSAHTGMLHSIAGLDIRPHAENVLDKIKKDNANLNELFLSIIENLQVVNANNFYLNYLKSILSKMKQGQSIKEAKKQTLNQLIGGIDRQINRLDTLDLLFTYNFIEAELSYKRLSDSTLNVLIPIIASGENINYNSSLIDICRELIKVSVCRWYEDGDTYVKQLKKADQSRIQKSYRLIEEIVEAANIGKESVKERKKLIEVLTREIRQKAEQALQEE